MKNKEESSRISPRGSHPSPASSDTSGETTGSLSRPGHNRDGDAGETRLVDQLHDLAHPLVLQAAVGLEHHRLVGVLVVDGLELRRHLRVRHPVLADEDAAVLLDGERQLLAAPPRLSWHQSLAMACGFPFVSGNGLLSIALTCCLLCLLRYVLAAQFCYLLSKLRLNGEEVYCRPSTSDTLSNNLTGELESLFT